MFIEESYVEDAKQVIEMLSLSMEHFLEDLDYIYYLFGLYLAAQMHKKYAHPTVA